MNHSRIRQLEVFRGYVSGLDLSEYSIELRKEIANDAGIKDYINKLDKKRHYLQLKGAYNVLIAFGGVIRRYLKRARLAVEDDEYILLQSDAIRALVLAIVDFKIANGRNNEDLVERYKEMIPRMCALDGPIKKMRKFDANGKMRSFKTGVDSHWICNHYERTIAPTIREIKVHGHGVVSGSNVVQLPQTQSLTWCPFWNLWIEGCTHVQKCTEENDVHKDNFHKCGICGAKDHKLINCRWIRAMMMLTKYNASMFKTCNDVKLPKSTGKPKKPKKDYPPRNPDGGKNKNNQTKVKNEKKN